MLNHKIKRLSKLKVQDMPSTVFNGFNLSYSYVLVSDYIHV